MSTRINIAADGFIALKQQADKVAKLNQQSAVKRFDDKQTADQVLRNNAGATNAASTVASGKGSKSAAPPPVAGSARPTARTIGNSKERRNDVPSTELVRELSAQLSAQPLVPFALAWNGNLTTQAPTVYEVQLRELEFNIVPPSIFTYSGGDYLAPSNFEVSSSKTLVSVPQVGRYKEWVTKGKIAYFDYYGREWSYEGFWAEQLRSDLVGTLTWDLPPCPGNLSPVGPIYHTPDIDCLAVGSAGTLFITVALPYEASTTSSVQTPSTAPPITTFDRDIIHSTNYEAFKLRGLQQYVSVDGVNLYNGLAVGPYPSKPLYKFAGQPYLFMRVIDGQTFTKTATKDNDQLFGDFYEANAWDDDPSRGMRGTYAGEVRVRNQQAHKLRMRFVDPETNLVYYEDFPYSSLSSFITGERTNARLRSGVTFEDHIYNLSPYSTSQELADLLLAIVNPTGYEDQPSYLPDRIVKLGAPSSLFALPASRLQTSGSDQLSPLTYFVAMP